MNPTPCALCAKTLTIDGVCARCLTALAGQISAIGQLWVAAHSELLPGNGGHGSSSGERTIGLNVAALSFVAGDDILATLHSWERLIRADRALTPPALLPKLPLGEEIAHAIAFQRLHLNWSARQPWIGDFAKEIADLHLMGTAAARQFVDKVRRISCPASTDEGRCGYSLILPTEREHLIDVFTCKRCGSEWTTVRLMAVALSDPLQEVWLDAEAIAEYIGVVPRYVHTFAKRHRLAKHGQRYNLQEVIAARKAAV